MGTLTIDCERDSFRGASVEVSVQDQTGVITCLHSQDLGDIELRSSVDLGVVVKPDILTGRVSRGSTQEADISIFQSCVPSIC